MTDTIRPYKLGERECAGLADLAAAMAENNETAAEHFDRGYIQKWLEEELREYDARIALDKLLEENAPEHAFFEFALRYAPDWTPTIDGFRVQPEFLDQYLPQLLKEDYVVSTSELLRFAAKLYDWNVLTDERVSGGNQRWAAIDAAWRREYNDAALTRGETLLYRSLWKVPGDALDSFLMGDRNLELVLARAAAKSPDHDPAQFEQVKTMLAAKEKLALLAELWVAEDPATHSSPRLKVEDGLYYQRAMKRAWFADMVGSDTPRTPGREAELHTAAKIAARQQEDVERQAEKAEADAATPAKEGILVRIDSKISALDPKVRAGAFALGLFVPLFFYERYTGSVLWGLLCWAALAATIGAGVMRVMPIKPDKRWIDVVGAIFIGWALFSYFAMDLDRSAFLYEAALGAVAGAIGFFWSQLGSVRRKTREREAEAARAAADPNDARRISPDALAKLFFPELILQIPFSQRTQREKEFAAAVEYGNADRTGMNRFADPRSPVAPNHGGGMSVSAGGFNMASDGTATTQLMDGVSFDNKDNWNVRVADGVTVHTDGKHTISMGGFDVRSDGQISTEIGGVRVSSKGKDEKASSNWLAPKEETDWFGNKKKKGWFD